MQRGNPKRFVKGAVFHDCESRRTCRQFAATTGGVSVRASGGFELDRRGKPGYYHRCWRVNDTSGGIDWAVFVLQKRERRLKIINIILRTDTFLLSKDILTILSAPSLPQVTQTAWFRMTKWFRQWRHPLISFVLLVLVLVLE